MRETENNDPRASNTPYPETDPSARILVGSAGLEAQVLLRVDGRHALGTERGEWRHRLLFICKCRVRLQLVYVV